MIRTEMTDGWLIEGGPQTIRETSPLIPLIMNTVGLKKARIDAAPEAKNRYIVRRGKPVPLPTTPGGLVFSPLLSPWGKLRLAMEPLRLRKSQMPDRSFAEFIRQHCGQEVVDYIAKPIATGIYAGDADLLSARHAFPKIWDMENMHGSFLRAQEAHIEKCRKRAENVVPATFSFRRGMQTLTHGYVLALPADVITLNARVEGLVPGPRWHVIWRDIGGQNPPADQDWSQADDTGRQVEGFDAVICALPGSAMARLEFGERNVRPMAELGEVPHASVASLFLGYRRDQVVHPLNGFGLLVPPKEKRSFLGVTFSSSVFPGRAPDGHVALTVMAGGILQPEMAALLRPGSARRREARPAEPPRRQGRARVPAAHRLAEGDPQYNLGHPRFNKAMSKCEKDHPGFFIAGHARHGISVANCICSGEDMAERAAVHGNSW